MEEIDLKNIRRYLDEAITYAEWDKARRAARLGLAAARRQGTLNEIMYFRAQQEIIAGRFREAMRYLDLAIRFSPADGAAYNDRALCMAELGMLQEAVPYFDKGIEVEPDYATVYHNKGWLLNLLGRHEEAVVCFKQTLDIDPDRPVTFENLGYAYQHLGRNRDARESYRKSLALLEGAHPDIGMQIEAIIEKLGE